MSDFQAVMKRLAKLERWQANAKKFGTVVQVEPGKVRVRFGKAKMGESTEEAPHLSPWIYTGSNQGFVSETRSYEIGEQVEVSSHNDDFSQATVRPYADSEHNPPPGDAKNDKEVSRIRKPRGKYDVSTEAEPTFDPKKDDDEVDNIYRRDHEGVYRRKGKAKMLFGMPEKQEDSSSSSGSTAGGSSGPASMKAGAEGSTGSSGQQSGSGYDKEQVWFEVGPCTFLMTEKGLTMTMSGGVEVKLTEGKIEAGVGGTGVTIEKGMVKWAKE